MAYPWEMDRHSFGTFLSCTICAFIAIFVSVMTASVVKIMVKDYEISTLDSMWLTETTSISIVVFSIFTIAISDKFGNKRTVT